MTYPILIPSRGRSDRVATVDRMPRHVQERVILFVPREELAEYRHSYSHIRVVTVSDYSHTISQKRERMVRWYVNNHKFPYFFWMMDDDLQFAVRDIPENTALRKFEAEDPDDWDHMLLLAEATAEGWGDPICAVGISLRQGNNNLAPEGATNTRLIRCGLYNTEAFLSCDHDRLEFMGDFDVMLQMLEMGYDNHVLSEYCQDHRGTNAEGGCEVNRNEEVMNRVANELVALHPPGVVRTKQKVNKTGELAVRTDVTIYWKKARASAEA